LGANDDRIARFFRATVGVRFADIDVLGHVAADGSWGPAPIEDTQVMLRLEDEIPVFIGAAPFAGLVFEERRDAVDMQSDGRLEWSFEPVREIAASLRGSIVEGVGGVWDHNGLLAGVVIDVVDQHAFLIERLDALFFSRSIPNEYASDLEVRRPLESR
jgi:hypothetical protein